MRQGIVKSDCLIAVYKQLPLTIVTVIALSDLTQTFAERLEEIFALVVAFFICRYTTIGKPNNKLVERIWFAT